MDSDAKGEGGGRRVEEGGNRYQTISADHHNVGGSTAVLLVEHRRYGKRVSLSAPLIVLMGPTISSQPWDRTLWGCGRAVVPIMPTTITRYPHPVDLG